MLIKKSGQSSIYQLLLALSFFLCISGCLEKATGPMQGSFPDLSDQLPETSLQMDYDVELSRDLFRLQGDLLLPGTANLGYILLNASLQMDGSPILNTKYLLMQVESNREYGFEICKSCRLESGDYDCILKAEAPQGIIAEEVRKVSLEGPRERPRGWSQAEETAFWRMIEEYDREDDDNVGDEREENESGAVEGEEGKIDEVMEAEARGEAGAIEEGAYREDDPKEDGVGKESLGESSNSESSSIALFSGYRAGGDGDGMSSNEERLVASKSSKKYHHPDCRFAQKIKPENLISFSGVEDAKREGYLPCKFCNP